MNYKLVILFFIFLAGSISYAADAIVRQNYSPRQIMRPSSSIISTNRDNIVNDYDSESLSLAIKELESKLKQTPNDYSINISLVELYIKNKQYDKSFDELVFLNTLNRNKKLSASQKNNLSILYDKLKKSAKYSQDKSSLYSNMAVFALIANNPSEAESFLVSASSGNINMSLLKKAVKDVSDSIQDFSKGILICDKILSLNPDDVEIRKMKAYFLLYSGDIDSAIKEFISVVNMAPTDEETKYSLYKLMSSKNLSEKYIVEHMYSPEVFKQEDAYYDFAKILLKNEQVKDAKKYAEYIINKFPNNPNGYIILSDIYRKEGKLKESYEALSKVREHADSKESISKYNVLLAKLSDQPLKEANSLIDNGLYQQALEVLESADPDNLYVILTNAKANLLLGEKQKSLESLNKAMLLYPENSDVYCSFAYVYLLDKDIESSRNYINKSLRINPDNAIAKQVLELINKAEAEKYLSKSIAAYENQEYKEAMYIADEAIKIYNKNAALFFHKGLIYIAQNNYAASTGSFYKCIELNSRFALAYFYLGLAFDNLSEPENALVNYQKFVDMYPSDEYGESEKLDYAQNRIEKLKH